jgi:hypothetical protein
MEPRRVGEARAFDWYYSRIDDRPRRIVSMFAAVDGQTVSDDQSGTEVLTLEPRLRSARLFDAEDNDRGTISAEGLVPGRFVLRRDGVVVWTLQVRSLVRRRHRLEMAGGDAWMFDTPFFWWQHLSGSIAGIPTLLGGIGPSTRYWGFRVARHHETLDVIAAVAFMHWKWWRW